MNIDKWIVLLLVFWFGVEFYVTNRTWRVSIQFVSLLLLCIVFYSFGALIGPRKSTLTGNVLLKNLSHSLVAISEDDEFDIELFKKRVHKLDDRVLPIYEDYSSSQEAVEGFLREYEFEFDHNIPISHPKS